MDRDDLLVLKIRGGDEKALETFARFFRTLRQYWHYGKAASYLYAIAANACRDYYRQNQNRELPVDQLPETWAAAVDRIFSAHVMPLAGYLPGISKKTDRLKECISRKI